MPTAPGVTLTANLASIIGETEGGGYLRITLCGSGPVIPVVAGTCVLEDATIPQYVGPQVGSTPIQAILFGNDVITPGPNTTFYEIAVLDSNKDVIQAGLYQFLNSAGAVDLSSATPYIGPYGFYLPLLAYLACSGAFPGTVYVAPGPVIAIAYNGELLPRGLAFPILSYTLAPDQVTATLNFNTEAGDQVDALCI